MPIAPLLLAQVPHKDPDAWRDYVGTVGLYLREIYRQIVVVNGKASYRTYPLGDGGGPEWQGALYHELINAARAQGIAGPPDLASHDLKDKQQFDAWTLQVAQTLDRYRAATGLA